MPGGVDVRGFQSCGSAPLAERESETMRLIIATEASGRSVYSDTRWHVAFWAFSMNTAGSMSEETRP